MLEKEFLAPVERRHHWLREDNGTNDREVIELLNSHNGPLWPEIEKRLVGRNVKKIAILAPFFDRDLSLLKLIKGAWPDARLSIFAQQKYATLEGKRLARLFQKKDRLFAVTAPPGRRLHAKLLAFETPKETFWLTGSPNATVAAVNGGNTETALWFSSEEAIDTILKDDSLTIDAIDPAAFEAGPGHEPGNEDDGTAGSLVLGSAVLTEDGNLDLAIGGLTAIRQLAVNIKNYNEAQPFLSLHVGSIMAQASVRLNENQIGQIHGAALCQLKGVQDGREITSNKVALVQLHELFQERNADSARYNRVRKISETGEELMAHLDSLRTVREAVEFLDHCSIRFEDGEAAGRGGGRPNWKARDPFVPDIPKQWLSQLSGSTAESLQDAVWRFVERHQDEKLRKHVRRGNLNGLPNFLDIFRTLNSLLIAFNRKLLNGVPVVPFPYVVEGIRTNLDLLMGAHDTEDGYIPGFVDAINANVRGDSKLVRERLQAERVPQILRAGTEAMVAVRLAGLKRRAADAWSMEQLERVTAWIARRGLVAPSPEDVQRASAEYTALPLAA
jgi:hypothetical protein